MVLQHRLIVVEHRELGHGVDLIRVVETRVAQVVQQGGQQQRKLLERREMLANAERRQCGEYRLTDIDTCDRR